MHTRKTTQRGHTSTVVEGDWPSLSVELGDLDDEIHFLAERHLIRDSDVRRVRRVARQLLREHRTDPGVVVCLSCGVDFDAFTEAGEPGYFADTHNRLHHRGNSVAFVTDVDAPASARAGEAA
jgi:hypothetical protein